MRNSKGQFLPGEVGPITHGEARGGRTKEYRIWKHMKGRCYCPTDKRYLSYGARGIYVCPEWLTDFPRFLADMGRCPAEASLDRKNNNAGYSPSNCRWATSREQANNTRRNRRVTCFGRTQTVAQWSRETGIDYEVLRKRLKYLGWTPEKALSSGASPVGGTTKQPRPSAKSGHLRPQPATQRG